MSKQHQKHSDIARPGYGFFHRNEWAVMGAPCGSIKQLAFYLGTALSDAYKIAYVDADHQQADPESAPGNSPQTALAHGAAMEYTDKIHFHRFDRKAKLDTYQYRNLFLEQDLVLVNGNHFQAQRQIVIIDPRKETSLQKKLDRLNQVDLILLAEGQTTPFPFLIRHLEEMGSPEIPVIAFNDTEAISSFLRQHLERTLPPVYGLVLAGGKSVRMGKDKGLIDYHGQPQREYAANMLQPFCGKVFISIRPDQKEEIQSTFPALADTFLGLGPLGAILSAFREYPDAAWLVIACDLPLLNPGTLEQLVRERKPGCMATAFNSPVNHLPEPLIAIWEPRSYPILLQFLAQGYACPRKALINSEIHLLEAQNPETLANVNNPRELEEMLNRMGK